MNALDKMPWDLLPLVQFPTQILINITTRGQQLAAYDPTRVFLAISLDSSGFINVGPIPESSNNDNGVLIKDTSAPNFILSYWRDGPITCFPWFYNNGSYSGNVTVITQSLLPSADLSQDPLSKIAQLANTAGQKPPAMQVAGRLAALWRKLTGGV